MNDGAAKEVVAIAGAGIAGLSAAIALKLAGFSVEIFEREQNPQAIGAGIQVGPNATRIMESWKSFAARGVLRAGGDRASQCAKRRAFEYGSASPGRAQALWRALHNALAQGLAHRAFQPRARARHPDPVRLPRDGRG